MAASVEIHCFSGSPLSDGGAIIGGADLCSDDNCVFSAANRIANPLISGSYSFEKWLRLKVTAMPDTWIGYLKIWGDGTIQTNTTLRFGPTAVAADPVLTPSIVAINDFTIAVVGSKQAWDLTVRTVADLGISPWTDYLVFQLFIAAAATSGDWTAETVFYEYLEA